MARLLYSPAMATLPKFYWKSTCTSCRTAKKLLTDRGIEVEDTNYAKAPLDAATLAAIVKAAGGVAPVLNKRHEIAKAKGWGEAPPSAAEFLAAAAAEPNLLRRPILIRGTSVLVGYDKSNEKVWAAL